jgi:hypothetical protein
MMSRITRIAAVVPAAAALTAAGSLVTATSASAAPSPMPDNPAGQTGYNSADYYNSGYSQGYMEGRRAARANDASDFPDSDAQQSNAHNYQPASAATGPNDAGAPRTSEAQTSQNEACGTTPGENTHTLGLPKIVNVNMC